MLKVLMMIFLLPLLYPSAWAQDGLVLNQQYVNGLGGGNQPIAIVPVDADTTCVIAASYQAKTYGIKTGTAVHDAKVLCPHVILVEARPGSMWSFIIGSSRRLKDASLFSK